MRIAQRILFTGGRATGFDYLRLVLALAIVVWHSVATSYGLAVAHALYAGPLRAVLGALLPMFFALSGFLVAGSLQRCRTLPMFLALRALRIFPALTVEVVLSALVLGPLLTTLPLAQYLADPLFWQYLRNAGGDVHFFLPGVFAGNPVRGQINAQLWTVPFELKC
jgi:peptidoglycan/LPS O-acetylase OafA/YrhL